MTGKTHQVLGITLGLTYYLTQAEPTYDPKTFILVLAVAFFAALLPDIDQPGSKLWRMLPFGHTVGKISDPFLEHRNLTHSIFGAALVSLILYFVFKLIPADWGIKTNVIFIVAIISYLSHLFADMWTNRGIPLLFPYEKFFGLPPKPFSGARMATGKWFENLVILPILTLVLIIVCIIYYSSIEAILFK